MPYIGNTVQNQGFSPAVDYYNGDGTTVTFTLSRPVASVAQLTAVIENVIQNPSTAFSVAGNQITFTSAPPAGTNNIWVEYTSLVTTYAAISQDPSVIGDITATGGFLAEGDFGNSFIDGTIVDYVSGNARITTGPSDAMTFYNGGTSSRTALMTLGATGNVGIGTVSPNDTLEVAGANAFIRVNRTGNEPGITFRYSNSSTNRGDIAVTSGGDMYFTAGGSTERMRIDASGRITTPAQPAFCYWMDASSGSSKNPTTNNSVVVFDGNPGGGLTGFNRGSNYSTSTGRFTAPVAGVYHFDMHAIANSSSNTSEWNYKININGAVAGDFRATNYIVSSGHISINLSLAANDYVDIRKNDGTGIAIYPNGHYSWFSGYLIG